MLLIIESIFEYYHKSPRLITFLLLVGVGILLIVYANAHKARVAGVDLPTSKSKATLSRKKFAFYAGVVMIVIAVPVLLGIIPIATRGLAPISPQTPQRIVNVGSEIGGYGELPIIRIPRGCFERAAHEYENFTLFGGNFHNEIDAAKRVSTLDAYNIRDVNYFQKKCDTIPLIGGTYFVFLGRRCTTLKSIQRYENKYETMFIGADSMDLKIVKWEDGTVNYSLD